METTHSWDGKKVNVLLPSPTILSPEIRCVACYIFSNTFTNSVCVCVHPCI